MLKKEWKEQGFINEPAAEGVDLKAEIRKMCKGLTTIPSAIFRR